MIEIWSYDDYEDCEELTVPGGVPRMPEGNDPEDPKQFGVMKIVKLKSAEDDGHCMTIVLPLGITVSVDHRKTDRETVSAIVKVTREVVYLRQLLQAGSGMRPQVNIQNMQAIERLGVAESLLQFETPFSDFLRLQHQKLPSAVEAVETSCMRITKQIVERLRALRLLGMFHINSPAGYFDTFTLSHYEDMLKALVSSAAARNL